MSSLEIKEPSMFCPMCGLQTPEHTPECEIGKIQGKIKASFKTASDNYQIGKAKVLQNELEELA